MVSVGAEYHMVASKHDNNTGSVEPTDTGRERQTKRFGLTEIGVIGVVLVLMLSVIPLQVVGQTDTSPPEGVPLDEEITHLKTVSVDGTTYEIYQYENALPYASGLEVYANGGHVTELERATPALRVIAAERALEGAGVENADDLVTEQLETGDDPTAAFQRVSWRRAAEELDGSDIETLRSIRSTAARIEEDLAPVESALDRFVNFIDRMKEQEVAGTSIWDAATQASPTLQGFDVTVRGLQDELKDWTEAARTVDESVPEVTRSLERMEAGEDIDYARLSRNFEATMAGLTQLRKESDELESRFAGAASTSATIASEVEGAPVVGEDISDGFSGLSDVLDRGADRVGGFSDAIAEQEAALSSVKDTAEEAQSELQSQYESELSSLQDETSVRNTAELRVYGTGAACVIGLGLVGRRVLG